MAKDVVLFSTPKLTCSIGPIVHNSWALKEPGPSRKRKIKNRFGKPMNSCGWMKILKIQHSTPRSLWLRARCLPSTGHTSGTSATAGWLGDIPWTSDLNFRMRFASIFSQFFILRRFTTVWIMVLFYLIFRSKLTRNSRPESGLFGSIKSKTPLIWKRI